MNVKNVSTTSMPVRMELSKEVKRAQALAESAARQRDSLQREVQNLRQQVQDVEAESRAKLLSLQIPVRNDEAKE